MSSRLPRLDALRHGDEAGFTRWLKRVMALMGVHGFHVRDSEGVMEGVVKLDAYGVPDWYIWKEGDGGTVSGWHMWRELKTDEGQLTPLQRLMHLSMRRAGEDVDVWRPRDQERILSELRRA
jgi:hypothetical protein